MDGENNINHSCLSLSSSVCFFVGFFYVVVYFFKEFKLEPFWFMMKYVMWFVCSIWLSQGKLGGCFAAMLAKVRQSLSCESGDGFHRVGLRTFHVVLCHT